MRPKWVETKAYQRSQLTGEGFGGEAMLVHVQLHVNYVYVYVAAFSYMALVLQLQYCSLLFWE